MRFPSGRRRRAARLLERKQELVAQERRLRRPGGVPRRRIHAGERASDVRRHDAFSARRAARDSDRRRAPPCSRCRRTSPPGDRHGPRRRLPQTRRAQLVAVASPARPDFDDDIAVLHLELAVRRARYSACGRSRQRDRSPSRSRLPSPSVERKPHAGHALIRPEHFRDLVVPEQRDLALLLERAEPVLQDRLGAELVATVNERDVRGDVGEVDRFLDCRVAAADDRHSLVAIEETVAGGAGRDAAAAKLRLGIEAEIARRRAGRDDERIAAVFARPRRRDETAACRDPRA